jgi:hypothetical protein
MLSESVETGQVPSAHDILTVTDAYIFLFFCVGVLIIRYDKMVSHMMPTCAFIFVIKARDPGKDLPYYSLDMCTL